MSDRQQVSLSEPPEASGLTGFPSRELTPEQTFYRVGRRSNGPWWFASSKGGRFNLESPHGTCYLAAEDLGALLEVIGPTHRNGWISHTFFSDRVIWRLQIQVRRRAADTTSRKASAFGVTAEIGALADYSHCQKWASMLHQAGFAALIYWLRHDPSRSEGLAVFGDEGEQDWPLEPYRDISEALLARLQEETGIRVAPAPRLDQLQQQPGD